MSDYSVTTDFSVKDGLTSGDPNKLVKGSDVDVEFDAIAVAVATKADKPSSPTLHNLAKLTAAGHLAEATSIKDDGTDVTIATTKNLKIADNGGLYLAGTQVTSTAAELNLLDGLSGTIWTTSNDGAGSGLDADLLDGVQGSGYLLSGGSDQHVAGTLTLAATTNITGTFQIGGTAVTSTATELNVLDGVTATATEVNELDASAAAISGYTSGIRTYFVDDGPSTSAFDPVGLSIGSSFASCGPTGSGATHTSTMFDDIPTGATAIILKIHHQITGSTDETGYVSSMYGRGGGGSATVGYHTLISEVQFTNRTAETRTVSNVTTAILALDSNRTFDLALASNGSPSRTTNVYMIGFIL